MATTRWDRICALFESARLATPAERAALLASDPEIAAEVAELLAQHDRPDAAMSDRVDLPVGETIGGYQVEQLLGTGGMGSVYLANGKEGRVALKMLHPHLVGRSGFRARFAREAALGQRVVHPNVVRALDVTSEGALVMEYVSGQTLAALQQELGCVPEDLCRHIGAEVARGLSAIHDAGIVHRDLKPENVLITSEHVVKLMDFGVAFPRDDLVRLSQTGQFVGTVRYCAPEQIDGTNAALDGRTDLYALGLVLYELATGQHPVPSSDMASMLRAQVSASFRRLGEINPQCSAFFEELVHTLLEKSPDARIGSATTLAEILGAGEDGPWWAERAQQIERTTKRPLRRIHIPRDTAVHGRDRELAQMQSCFEQTAAGNGQVLLIEGEAGIGKTRLIDEATTRIRLATPEVDFLFGAHPLGTGTQGVSAMRAALFDFLGRADLEARLGEYLEDMPTLVPAFAAFLRGDAPPADTPPLASGNQQGALVACVTALCQHRPMVLVLDDLHFASQEGLAVFSALASVAATHPLMLVGTLRPTLDAWRNALERLDHVCVLSLPRLGPKELSALLVDAFRSRPLAEQLGFRIAEKSDGNPYFVFEIVRALKESRRVVPTGDGGWTTAEAFQEVEVPASVREVIRIRLNTLADDEREILDVAACLGAKFQPKLVAQALDRKLIPVLRALSRIERDKRLVRASGPVFVFDHHQVQETLYEQLSEPLREAYHAAIGDVLFERAGTKDLVGEDAMQACLHLAMGSQFERAIKFVKASYDQTWQRGIWDVGATLFRRLLIDDKFVVGETRVDVLVRLAECYEVSNQAEDREAALKEALRIGPTCDNPRAHIRAWGGWAWYLVNADRLDEAAEAYQTMSRMGEEHDFIGAVGAAAGNLATIYLHKDQYERALKQIQGYLEIVHEQNDQYGIASGTGILGQCHLALRAFDVAEKTLRKHVTICQEQRDLRAQALSSAWLGYLFMQRGETVQAQEWAQRATQLGRQLGDRPIETEGTFKAGHALYEAGEWDDARDHLQRALQMSRVVVRRAITARCCRTLAALHDATGNAADARALLEESLALMDGRFSPVLQAKVLCDLASSDEVNGRDPFARYREASDLIRHTRGPLAQVVLRTAHALEASRDRSAANKAFSQAGDLASEGRHASVWIGAMAGLTRTGNSPIDEAIALGSSGDLIATAIERIEIAYTLGRTTGEAHWIDQARAQIDTFCEPMQIATRELAKRHHPIFRAVAAAET